jgi:preprotein translocase subunit SecA
MINSALKKIFGSANDRTLKKFHKIVHEINKLEQKYTSYSDADLQNMTPLFRERLAKGETLDDILPEAFAVVREASKRVFGMRHHDVQMIGGIALHQGMLSEMRTGEGKTLVATLPVYLNGLSSKGVHLITINDYLASRDSAWMGKLYRFMGLTVGCIVHGLMDHERREQYGCDITYGTNHEFGFDYLRDNMKFRLSDMVMRPFNYALVDEVDSILVDEARTPLIISGAAEDSSDLYRLVNQIIPQLVEGDYEKDEKQKSVTLTDSGMEKIELGLKAIGLIQGDSLYNIQNVSIVHHVNAALKAHKMFTRDVDYIVKDDKVIIIDEFTGRMMDGRRYSEGLHQAIEAKENVNIEMENQTLASITYQNYFRLYPKLSGMSGTVITEATEFEEIYKLKAVEIPTNKPVARIDYDDEIYLTAREKYEAIAKQIQQCYDRQQPVLVGTTSIEKSEFLSELLKKNNVPHNVLNARYHEQEAYIVAEAGRPGAITIATNMAGRGTDIKLGGNLDMRLEKELLHVEDPAERVKITARIEAEIKADCDKALAAGGLYVLGTERHESRRIDNQLRGRSGRQGDPGASKFFISLEDDLMRIFGSDNLSKLLRRMGAEEGEVISHAWMTKALERAQQKVEARNFDIRKHLLKYDDVMNDQRKVIYEQRKELMNSNTVSEVTVDMVDDILDYVFDLHMPENSMPDLWDLDSLHAEIRRLFNVDLDLKKMVEVDNLSSREIKIQLQTIAHDALKAKEESFGAEMYNLIQKDTLLRVLDQSWKNHLLSLDQLRQGINLRAYAQSNPLNEYKREAFNMFQVMMDSIRQEYVAIIAHLRSDFLKPDVSPDDMILPKLDFDKYAENHPDFNFDEAHDATLGDMNTIAAVEDINRNTPCPCGSQKKYKHCHGKLDV